MIPFLQYIETIDKDKPDFLRDMQEKRGKEVVESYDELSEEEKAIY